MKGPLFAAAVMLLGASSASIAQTPFDVSGAFERVDTNGDGRITPDEVRRDASVDFDKYDLDGDGVLSREEVRKQQLLHGRHARGAHLLTPALLEQATATAFAYFDFDGDGRITREDYIQRAISQVLLADADGDGAVTPEELHRFHGQRPR